MNTRVILVGIVAIGLAVAVMLLTGPSSDDAPEPPPTRGARTPPAPSGSAPSPKRASSPRSPGRTAPDPSSEPDAPVGTGPTRRPPPLLSFTTGVSPYAAEEGLRAFADAAGLAVVRCRTDSEIPADLLDAVGPSALVGADLVVPVEPSAEEGTEKLKVWSAGDYSLFLQYSDAFPGESGSCRMQIQERNAPPNPGGKVAPPLDQEPLRIALERDDLTDGARRWLEEQLGEAGALAIPEE